MAKLEADEIARRLTPLFRDAFPEADAGAIGPQTVAEDVTGWDSMAHVSLIVSIEEGFEIRFEPEGVTGFSNVGELIALIAGKTGLG
jgi:acyl carrier protein